GQIRRSLGDARSATVVLGEGLALLVDDLVPHRMGRAFHPALSLRTTLIRALIELGEFERAKDVGREVVDLAESLRHTGGIVMAYQAASRLPMAQGRFADAIPHLERALELSRQAGIPFSESVTVGYLGHAYTM